jgi:hypothetical protein
MLDLSSAIDFASVPPWLTLGLIAIAALSLILTLRYRAHSQARQISIEGRRNDLWFFQGTAGASAPSFSIWVSNDSDKPIRLLEFSAWEVDQSGRSNRVGSFVGTNLVGPHSVASGDPRLPREGRSYPTRKQLQLAATFKDADDRWWYLEDSARAKRLSKRERQRRRSTEADGQIHTATVSQNR